MSEKYKNIIIIVIGVFVTYTLGAFIFTLKTGYSIYFGSSDEYKFLFKKEYWSTIDTISVKDYRKSDYFASCRMKNYLISIQEIYDLKEISISSIKFHENIEMQGVDFYPAQIINMKIKTNPTVRAYWNISFDSILNVSFNEKTQIDSIVRGENCICYHAHIDKMLFSNGDDKEMMFYDFSEKSKNTLLLFLKKRNRFFIIMVNSREDFGMEALDIFDL